MNLFFPSRDKKRNGMEKTFGLRPARSLFSQLGNEINEMSNVLFQSGLGQFGLEQKGPPFSSRAKASQAQTGLKKH